MAVSSWALVSLEEAKDYLGVSSPGDDYLIERVIDAATLACEQYAHRTLKSRTHTDEVYHGTGGYALRLDQPGVTSVTAVSFLTAYPSTWTPQSLTDYPVTITGARGFEDTIFYRNNSFPRGVANVKVSYVAGIASPSQDLKQACLQIVLHQWKAKDRVTVGIASQSYQGQTTVYRDDAIPKSAALLLGPYVRAVF